MAEIPVVVQGEQYRDAPGVCPRHDIGRQTQQVLDVQDVGGNILEEAGHTTGDRRITELISKIPRRREVATRPGGDIQGDLPHTSGCRALHGDAFLPGDVLPAEDRHLVAAASECSCQGGGVYFRSGLMTGGLVMNCK